MGSSCVANAPRAAVSAALLILAGFASSRSALAADETAQGTTEPLAHSTVAAASAPIMMAASGATLPSLADIVERVYQKVGFSKKEATEVVESIFELVKRRLEQGEKVKISGFGNFVVNEKRPRKGRNPQTGDEITISGRRVLTFKASQVLKKTMNGGPPEGNGG